MTGTQSTLTLEINKGGKKKKKLTKEKQKIKQERLLPPLTLAITLRDLLMLGMCPTTELHTQSP